MAFLRNLLATIVGLFIFSFLSFFFFIGIASAFETDTAPAVADNSILYLKLGGIVEERTIDDPLQDVFPNSGPKPIGLHKLLGAIDAAKEDSKIKGIYMENKYLSAGFSSLQEIRDALLDFQESGKFIIAYGEYVSEADYYLSSVADQFYLNPQGSLEFNGLSANVTFYKGLFDKLGIKPQIFRVGEFKGAVEPFIRKDLSEENRLQTAELLESVYGYYLEGVSETRNLEVDELRDIADGLKAYDAEDAVSLGLIDELKFEDQVKSELMDLVDVSDLDDLEFTLFGNYAKTVSSGYSSNKVAVIVADGAIVMGSSDEQVVAGETFAREIRKARESSSVKAIVLRINSPGGSLTASDMIWREIELTKRVKPVIASMGNVAASGGYYIAMNADTIIAQPNTITGSIGIFGMLFNFEKLLEDKMGITSDVVNTGEYSDLITVTRDLTDFEIQTIQSGVNKGYETFTSKVAEGRGMDISDVKKIAGGRVWSGLQAKELGLVDVLGDFEDAVTLAAESAGVEDDFQLRFYPKQKQFIEQIMGKLGQEASIRLFGNTSNIMTPYIETIEELSQMNGLQVRMPSEITIK